MCAFHLRPMGEEQPIPRRLPRRPTDQSALDDFARTGEIVLDNARPVISASRSASRLSQSSRCFCLCKLTVLAHCRPRSTSGGPSSVPAKPNLCYEELTGLQKQLSTYLVLARSCFAQHAGPCGVQFVLPIRASVVHIQELKEWRLTCTHCHSTAGTSIRPFIASRSAVMWTAFCTEIPDRLQLMRK